VCGYTTPTKSCGATDRPCIEGQQRPRTPRVRRRRRDEAPRTRLAQDTSRTSHVYQVTGTGGDLSRRGGGDLVADGCRRRVRPATRRVVAAGSGPRRGRDSRCRRAAFSVHEGGWGGWSGPRWPAGWCYDWRSKPARGDALAAPAWDAPRPLEGQFILASRAHAACLGRSPGFLAPTRIAGAEAAAHARCRRSTLHACITGGSRACR